MKHPIHSPILRTSVLLSCLLSPATSLLFAETVTVSGNNGAYGGDAETIGGSGGAGSNGQSVTATASAPSDPDNTAIAFGGNGGRGGHGHPGSEDPYIATGSGGSGGKGGNSTAVASTVRSNGDARATATAAGGEGGSGGNGGSAGTGGFAGAAGADANATTGTGEAFASAQATGGGGGTGGIGDTVGGAARPGGSAHASANGSNSSNQNVSVYANATASTGGFGGNGAIMGNGAPGGTATLGTVTGNSTGGGSVSVGGIVQGGLGGTGNYGGNGAHENLTNAVSANTTGFIYLSQQAYGGGGGTGNTNGGSGGSASSIFGHTDTTAAGIHAYIEARGGYGGQGFVQAGAAAAATAQLNLSSAGDMSPINVIAIGGQGGAGPVGAPGAVGQILHSSAVSTGIGKTVSLTAQQVGGEGGWDWYPENSGGNGADSHMHNVISGSAPGGFLTLVQLAQAGRGVKGGDGGAASSTLTLPAGNPGGGSLTARVQALGGNAYLTEVSQTPGTPGSSTAVCDLHNAGDVNAEAQATPGVVSIAGSADSSPAAANATASAVCTVPFRQAYARADQGGRTAASGTLSATAHSFGGIFSEVGATASAPSTISTSTSVGTRVSSPATPSVGGSRSMMVHALPDYIGSLPRTEGMFTLAEIDVTGGFTNGSTTMVMNPAGFTGSLKLGLVSGSGYFDGGLTSVQFAVTRGGSALINQTFTDGPALAAYFDSQVIDLGPVGLVAGQPLTFSFTLSGASAGFSASMFLAAQPQAPFNGWAAGYGISNVLDYNADSDLDGENDLLEFAFNSNPLNGSKGSHLPVQILADRLRIQFNRRRGDTQGLTYLLETSSSLAGPAAWQPMAHPWTIVNNPLNDTMESVTCEIPREEAPQSLFVRTKVQAE